MIMPLADAIERTVGYLRSKDLPQGASDILTVHLRELLALEYQDLHGFDRREIKLDMPMEKPQAGWIEWGGGACPVLGGVQVQVRYRDSSIQESKAFPAGRLRWRHSDGAGSRGDPAADIVAYRVCAT